MLAVYFHVPSQHGDHTDAVTSKTLFIVPTDAHYYKITEMLKQFKIIISGPFAEIKQQPRTLPFSGTRLPETQPSRFFVHREERLVNL